MKKSLVAFFLAAFAVFSSWSEETIKVAVVEFTVKGNVGIEDAGTVVAEWLSAALARTAAYEVLERILLDKVLEEQELALSGMIDESTAIKIGELYGADAIATGTLIEWNGTFSISAKIIDVETAKILKSATFSADDIDDIRDKMDSIAKVLEGRMSQAILDRDTGDIVAGGFPVSIVKAYMKNGRERILLDKGASDGLYSGLSFVIVLPVWAESEVTGEKTPVGYRRVGTITLNYIEPSFCGGDLLVDFTERYSLEELEREGIAILASFGMAEGLESYNAGLGFVLGFKIGACFYVEMEIAYETPAIPEIGLINQQALLGFSFAFPLIGSFLVSSHVDIGISFGNTMPSGSMGFFAGVFARAMLKGFFLKIGANAIASISGSEPFTVSFEPLLCIGWVMNMDFDGRGNFLP